MKYWIEEWVRWFFILLCNIWGWCVGIFGLTGPIVLAALLNPWWMLSYLIVLPIGVACIICLINSYDNDN
jgi:hypothetical protein